MDAVFFIEGVVVPERSAVRLCCNVGRDRPQLTEWTPGVINQPAGQQEVKLKVKIPASR